MRTWRSFIATASILAAICAAGGWVARGASAGQLPRAKVGDVEYRLLDALNDRIQERFRKLDDRRFGYGRIATVRTIPHRFDAESVGETSALGDLERARLRVVMYLAGRSVLRADEALNAASFPVMSLIKGPVVVTPTGAQGTATGGVTAIPAPLDLLGESRNALLAFGEAESTEFVLGDWTFVARPVRASEGVCFSCHRESSLTSAGNSLRIGDPLGAVLYGYRPLR